MKLSPIVVLPLAALSLVACESQAEQEADVMEDQVEQQAETSAMEAGDAEAALGLTEAQLIDADLVMADGTEIGAIEAVRRNDAGDVENLLVEVENTDPDRYVLIPLDGLTTRQDGDDMDVQTTMTAEELAALPDAPMDAPATPAAQ